MRTENEWQLREKELLESNNQLLERARKAEQALTAIQAGKPQIFWFADDGEDGFSDVEELLDYADHTYQVVEIATGYHGPTIFAAKAWKPDMLETFIIETHSRQECQRLVDLAKQACEDFEE
jgi:hypothetical protein